MAARNKRSALDLPKTNRQNENDNSDEDSDSDSENGMDNSDQDDLMETEIQVDFEARGFEGQDQAGVENLLRQLFLKTKNIAVGLTDILFQQPDVGSVIKQSEIPEDSDDEDDDDVFGVISVVNITEKKSVPSVSDLRDLLLTKAKDTGDDVIYTTVNRILNDTNNHVGFIICERFVNIPSRIAPLMYESLRSEIETVKAKKLPYDFAYYIIISKVYQPVSNSQIGDDVYVNQEDAIFLKDSLVNFKFKLENTDTAMEGHWNKKEVQLSSCRQVLLLKADKFNFVVENLKNSLEN